MFDTLKNKLGLGRVKTYAFDEKWKKTKTSLVKILHNQKEIWKWNFGIIFETDVAIWNRKRKFATKTFHDSDNINYSLTMFAKLKKLWIPTRTTYRKLWKKSVLMTLWNKPGEQIFSANNESDDSMILSVNPIEHIGNMKDLFSISYEIMKTLTNNDLSTGFDSYLFKYYKNTTNVDVLLWDFDVIKRWDKTHDVKLYNIEELLYSFRFVGKYFAMWNKLFYRFSSFLLARKKAGDEFLQGVDIRAIVAKVKDPWVFLSY